MDPTRRLPALGVMLLVCIGLTRAFQAPQPSLPVAEAIEQNNIGVGYMNQYQFEEAAAAFRKAISTAPDFNLPRINLGIALLYNQELDEAYSALSSALEKDSGNPYTNFCLGLLHKNRGNTEKAIEHFLRVAEVDSACAPNHYNLGILYARQRKNAEAEAALRRALQLEPDNTSALYNLGTLLLKLPGKREEGNTLLARFRKLQQGAEPGTGMSVGTMYGEMGDYAVTVDYRPLSGPVQGGKSKPGSAAPFADHSEEAGLSPFRASEVRSRERPHAENAAARENGGRDSPGGSIALGDLDNDGKVDAVVTRVHAGKWQTLVLRNENGKFTDITHTSGVSNDGSGVAVALGDVNNDDLLDMYLAGSRGNRLYRSLGRSRFQELPASTGLGIGESASSATFVDYDHDGDLDIYVCSREGSNLIFRNNGNGTFLEYAARLGVAAAEGRSLAMVPTDLDNDRDIDLLVVNEGGPPLIFSNERNDTFRDISSSWFSAVNEAFHAVSVADFNRDGAMDVLLVPGTGKGEGVLLVNSGTGALEPDPGSPEMLKAMRGARCAGHLDYDNDGDLDIFVAGDSPSLWENNGSGKFNFAGRLEMSGAQTSALGDFNADGRIDILWLDRSGSPRLLLNESSGENQWIAFHMRGLRSNKPGFGAKVEIRTLDRYQKLEIAGQNGSRSQDSPLVHLGLGRERKADTVTIRWPSGILQSEINAGAGRIHQVRELDRKGTSCPLLYTWNGDAFEFVTDFLGGSAIGYLQHPGRYSIPDTDEYIRIEGRQLAAVQGRYLLNLNNQLEEVILFDQAQLLVVDHPAGTGIYPNERLMPGPPYPEFRIFTTRDARPPVSAIDGKGRDVLQLISAKDRLYPEDFRPLPFKGYAEPHSIEMDLGDLKGASKILLLLDAWIDYADSSSNLAASQANVKLQPPSLQVRDAKGLWRTVLPSMGFPAGLPKTMTIDLTGKFLTRNFQIRITTNMKIYWDRILVDTSPDATVRMARLDPVSADLHFRGYPAYYSPDGRLPWTYDYGQLRSSEYWGTHSGAYTRYGNVRELLVKRDDEFVITRHGDEISLCFDAGAAPPVPSGWVRDFLLYADGYGKDMDLNSLYSEVIGLLPFHGMSRYPYPSSERYPDDEEHRRYLREYNTRIY
jgi:Flp pilus assembly protein TadD